MIRQAQGFDKTALLSKLFKYCHLSIKKRLIKEVSANGIISNKDIAKMVPVRLIKHPNKLQETMSLLLVLLDSVGVKVFVEKDDEERTIFLSKSDDKALQDLKGDSKALEPELEKGEVLEKFFEETRKDILSLYLAEVRRLKLLTKPAVYLLTSNYRAYRNISSRNKIVEHNLRLAIKFARPYRGRGVEFIDLIQEANMGLISATESFEDERDVSFSSYAFWWIKHFIMRAIKNQSNPFRLPFHILERRSKIAKVINRFLEKEGRNPDLEEIMTLTGIRPDEVKLILNRVGKIKGSLSLDEEVFANGDGETIFHEKVPDHKVLTPEEIAILKEELNEEIVLIREILNKIRNTFKRRDFEIFVARYGFNDSLKRKTLEEIGHLYGITRERVRQIEDVVLGKILDKFKTEDCDGVNAKLWFEDKISKIETLHNITGTDLESSFKDF